MKKLFAVIGNPIAHSMSPLMHNDLFDHYGIDAHYHAFAIEGPDLEDAVKGFRAIHLSGFNVTVPHKLAIMPLLDAIDPLARSIGAVNTVVNNNGKLTGYNTDGSGFVNGLLTKIESIQDKNVLIIGAGGAARAIYFTLAHEGVTHIDITNRTIERAEKLSDDCPYPVKTSVLRIDEAEKQLEKYEIVIQTTSIGMSPQIECEPLSLHNLSKRAFVSDIIYNPLETKFLQTAREKGANTQNGIEMFVNQGALAFEKWIGILPDTNRMKKKVLTQLGGAKC